MCNSGDSDSEGACLPVVLTTASVVINARSSIVSFVAAVQMSVPEFDAARADYIAGVAAALGRAESAVAIVSVEGVVTRRRLLADSVRVETAVTVAADEAESVARSVTADNLNSALASRGLRVAEVADVTVSAAGGADSTTPRQPPTFTERSNHVCLSI